MPDPKNAKKPKSKDPKELSFGKQMTSLLIVKNMRSNPKELLKGIAFIGFICFFLFSFMSRGCQRDAEQMQGEQRESSLATQIYRS